MVRLQVAPPDLDGSAAQHCLAAVTVAAAGAKQSASIAGAAAYPATMAAARAFASAMAAQAAAHGGTLTGMGGKVVSTGARYVATDSAASSHVRDAVAV